MKELNNCPFCNGELVIKKVECTGCGAEISGSFKTNRFHLFNEEQLFFIETFLKNEGNIKQVEKDLGISYPTVKNRLQKIIEGLGYIPSAEEIKKRNRLETLELLAKGEINVDEALTSLGNSL